MICPPAVHFNPTKYEDPNVFNPWRWKVRKKLYIYIYIYIVIIDVHMGRDVLDRSKIGLIKLACNLL